MWREPPAPLVGGGRGLPDRPQRHRRSSMCFDYPVPGPDGDEDAALTAHRGRLRASGIFALVLSVVPQDKAERLAARYPYVPLFHARASGSDYIYRRRGPARLRRPPLLRPAQPHQQVPQALSRRRLPPAREERPAAHRRSFFRDYEASLHQGVRLGEKRAALRRGDAPHDRAARTSSSAAWTLNGRLLSVAMAERCGDTLQHSYRKSPLRL